jgi:hypothetical protein
MGGYMLRLWIVVSSALIMSGLYGIQKIEASPQTPMMSSENGKHFERVVLKYLWPALNYGEKVGRIYYSAACQPNNNLVVSFPRLDVRPPSNGKIGIAAVRDIFRNEKDVSVKEAGPGIIRVRIGSVSDTLLRVRISNLVLTPEEQYNYWLAIFKIENAPEVQSVMQKLKIRTPARVIGIGIMHPADGLPHLPGVITNVTMDQALDLVAKTFRGVVLYESCTPPGQYEIRFTDAGDIYSTLNE